MIDSHVTDDESGAFLPRQIVYCVATQHHRKISAGVLQSAANFWLAKLNEFGGNFIQAEMVKAFLVSGEYRSRFGQQ